VALLEKSGNKNKNNGQTGKKTMEKVKGKLHTTCNDSTGNDSKCTEANITDDLQVRQSATGGKH